MPGDTHPAIRRRFSMIKRRTMLGGALSAATVAGCGTPSPPAVAQAALTSAASAPLVWPVVVAPQPGIRAFAGHTDTVPDVVGRFGAPPGLVIFTEGNHLMALLGPEIF